MSGGFRRGGVGGAGGSSGGEQGGGGHSVGRADGKGELALSSSSDFE